MPAIKKLIISLVLSLILLSITHSKAIIWDFDNTLVKVDRLTMANAIGLSDFLLYTILDFKNPYHLIDEVFHLLDHIKSDPSKHELIPTTDQKPLPRIFSHWLDGTWEYSQINQMVSNLIKSFSANNYFDNERHQRLIENSMKNMFNPIVLSNSIKPIKSALSLLKSCVSKKNIKGELEHEPFLLSNLASGTLDYFIQTAVGREVLSYFKPENIIISGDVGMIKPNEDIYLYFLKKFHLNPKDCVFIDDQISNINAAKKLGIQGIWVENSNFGQVKRQLQALQVI